MNKFVFLIFLILLFGIVTGYLTAQESRETQNSKSRFRVNIVASVANLGFLDVERDESYESLSLSYGFSPGLDVYYILNNIFEVGLGIHYQFERKVLGNHNGSSNYGNSSFLPICAALRLNLDKIEKLDIYAVFHLGYNFFLPDNTFLNKWDVPPAQAKAEGGVFSSIGLGVGKKLVSYSKWGLYLNVNARYDLNWGFIVLNESRYTVLSGGLNTALSLDFVF